MRNKGRLLFLGTGGSAGVPMIGCSCAVCTSNDAKNRRMRSSALLKVGGKQLLIDAGPDFREQALRCGIVHLDAVLLTHAHSDHIAGMDDLRAFYFLTKEKLPCVLSADTLREVQLRYHYFFTPVTHGKSLSAQLDVQVLPSDFGHRDVAGVNVSYLSYFQQSTKVTGFRVGKMAYVSDIRTYSDEVIEALRGVEVLVVSALRHGLSAMHFGVDEAIAFARRVGATSTYLTHISHELDHGATNALLPSDVRLSYDGLEIEFDAPIA